MQADLSPTQAKLLPNMLTGYLEKTKTLVQPYQEVYLTRENINVHDTAVYDDKMHLWVRRPPKVATREFQHYRTGYYPIKMMIYGLYRLRLMNLYRDILQQGLTPLRIHVDAIYVQEHVTPQRLDMHKVVSKPHLIVHPTSSDSDSSDSDSDTEIRYHRHLHTTIDSMPSPSSTSSSTAKYHTLLSEENYKVDNEAYLAEFCEYVERLKHRDGTDGLTQPRVYISGARPGTGKSWLCCQYALRHARKPLIVCMNNQRARTLRHEYASHDRSGFTVKTLYSVLQIQVRDAVTKGSFFLASQGYDLLIFEELASASVEDLQRVAQLITLNGHITCLANGDLLQNRVEDDLLCMDTQTYIRTKIHTLFPHTVHLTVSKRYTNPETEHVIDALHHDLFVAKLNLDEVIRKHKLPCLSVHDVNDQDALVAYTNRTCDTVNQHVHRGQGIREGMFVKCKGYLPKRHGLHRNCVYQIHALPPHSPDKTIVLLDVEEKKEYSITLAEFQQVFSHIHCSTSHSTQGDTYASPRRVVFFDAWKSCTTREAFYTTFTRAQDHRQVYMGVVPRPSEESESKSATSPATRRAKKAQTMIAGYKAQDRQAGRTWNESDYMDVQTLTAILNKYNTCFHCGDEFEEDSETGKDDGVHPTLDRINNAFAHVKRNVVVACERCNCRRRRVE